MPYSSMWGRPAIQDGAPAALFAAGIALLVAGWPAGLEWPLIVVALGWAAHCPSAGVAGSPSEHVRDRGADRAKRCLAAKHRHLGQPPRSMCASSLTARLAVAPRPAAATP